jgi:plastocyanin domain-containing protein
MTFVDIGVILVGLMAIGGIAWFFWGPRHSGTRATAGPNGYQEAFVLVKGGYTPDTIIVQHGKPVRLNFRREESNPCSEMVVLPDFGKSAHLPEKQVVPVEFLPAKAGTYEFSCQMGMFRGKLVVE